MSQISRVVGMCDIVCVIRALSSKLPYDKVAVCVAVCVAVRVALCVQ